MFGTTTLSAPLPYLATPGVCPAFAAAAAVVAGAETQLVAPSAGHTPAPPRLQCAWPLHRRQLQHSLRCVPALPDACSIAGSSGDRERDSETSHLNFQMPYALMIAVLLS